MVEAPFSTFDAPTLLRATEVVGSSMAQAIALTTVDLIRDETMPPAELFAGIFRAHLLGAASILVASRTARVLDVEQLAGAASDFLRAELAIPRRADTAHV